MTESFYAEPMMFRWCPFKCLTLEGAWFSSLSCSLNTDPITSCIALFDGNYRSWSF